MTAHEALSLAPADALEAGLRIPCAEGGDGWISDDAAERADAAGRCDGCPCLTECAEAADSTVEKFGVWGRVDRSPHTRNPGRPPAVTPEQEKPCVST